MRAPAFSLVMLCALPALAQEPAPAGADADAPIVPRRVGPSVPERYFPPPVDPSQVPRPAADAPRMTLPVPDRWRIMRSLGFASPWYDPYNQNALKGDLPIAGEPWLRGHFPALAHALEPDWFVSLGAVSDTVLEARRLPTAVGPQSNERPGSYDVFGRGKQWTAEETLIASFSLIRGDTTFRPPDFELRFVPAFEVNRSSVQELRVLEIDPRAGTTRNDSHAAVQELFVDKHLRNVSARYDFDAVRAGIQPFNADFRGFLFHDTPLGVRFFGTRDNNQWQYNLAWFRRLEKDTNSGLNDLGTAPRREDLFVANAYRQDFPVPGFTSQAVVVADLDREGHGAFHDANGFQVRPAVMGDARPHDYRVTYLGYNGDGHLGRWNLSASLYAALGRNDHDELAGRSQSIRAGFAAAELSRDFSWVRLRLDLLAQSADRDPFDGKATGFDAILENPLFAGADTSFWIRQGVPLIGGGGVALSGRNGVLASLRSSKTQGQANFSNPGLLLAGAGADFDLTPQLRAIGNVSYQRFGDTTVLGVLRNQAPPDREIGWDISGALQWRPFMTQNIVVSASAAALLPGRGLKQLYDEGQRGPQYSMLANVVLTF